MNIKFPQEELILAYLGLKMVLCQQPVSSKCVTEKESQSQLRREILFEAGLGNQADWRFIFAKVLAHKEPVEKGGGFAPAKTFPEISNLPGLFGHFLDFWFFFHGSVPEKVLVFWRWRFQWFLECGSSPQLPCFLACYSEYIRSFGKLFARWFLTILDDSSWSNSHGTCLALIVSEPFHKHWSIVGNTWNI